MRRCERKKIDQFSRDHCLGWRPPRKLRKIRYTEADIKLLYEIRALAIEAGRNRMVARGLKQYAKPGELCGCGSKEDRLENVGCEHCNSNVWFCPTCRTVTCVDTRCKHHEEGEVLANIKGSRTDAASNTWLSYANPINEYQ